jgi:hypothetical protein
MAIARNKKPNPDAIAAFGAAADARPDEAPIPLPIPGRVAKTSQSVTSDLDGPKSSLVRWTDVELRDRLIDYSKRERYPLQQVMIAAMKLGIEQIEKR